MGFAGILTVRIAKEEGYHRGRRGHGDGRIWLREQVEARRDGRAGQAPPLQGIDRLRLCSIDLLAAFVLVDSFEYGKCGIRLGVSQYDILAG